MISSLDEVNPTLNMKHIPVLLDVSLEYLSLDKGGKFLDGTFGGGGHTKSLLDSSLNTFVISIDKDPDAELRANKLYKKYPDRFKFYKMDFSNIDSILESDFDGVLFDFGLSSFQLDDAQRGFSFRLDSFLDMRMDNGNGITASEFLETATELDLIRSVRDYGEEASWRKVVNAILNARGTGKLSRTNSFANLIKEAIGENAYRTKKINPVTKTFQGIRIAVNNELESIDKGLNAAFRKLKPGGVLVAISFHSLEDRIVKRYFRKLAGRPEHRKDSTYLDERKKSAIMLNKRPIIANNDEIVTNPRSRSAKLRAIKKI